MSNQLYLTRSEQSAYLKEAWGLDYAPSTLAKLACLGGGPKYRHIGARAKSTPEWLDEFAQSKIGEPLTSTSEAA